MTDNQHVRADPWQRALSPSRQPAQAARRPKQGPGRHRPEVARADPWTRALTGPPISEDQRPT